MFKKSEIGKISVTNICAIEGYTFEEGVNLRIAMVDRLAVVKGFNPKKNDSVEALIATATIYDNYDAEKYGRNVIVVSKKFTKLPKKQQLALIAIENAKAAPLQARFDTNTDDSLVGTEQAYAVTAELIAIEEFGFRTVKNALGKEIKLIRQGEKSVGGYMHSEFKRAAKVIAKAEKKASKNAPISEELEPPMTLNGVDAAPAI